MGILVYLLILLIFVFLSFAISGTETAYFSLRKRDLQYFRKERSFLEQVFEKPESFLLVILLLNNVFNAFASSTFTEISLMLFPYLPDYLLNILDIILFTLILLLFGEITPKILAYSNPIQWTMRITPFFHFIYIILGRILFPFYWVLKKVVELFPEKRAHISFENEIKPLLSIAKKRKLVAPSEEFFLSKLLKYWAEKVSTLITPIEEVISYDEETPVKNILLNLKQRGKKFSHFPVYRGNKKNIIGIIRIWDMLKKGNYDLKLKDIVKPVPIYNHHISLLNIFLIMWRSKQEFALIRKRNHILGYITMKDMFNPLLYA